MLQAHGDGGADDGAGGEGGRDRPEQGRLDAARPLGGIASEGELHPQALRERPAPPAEPARPLDAQIGEDAREVRRANDGAGEARDEAVLHSHRRAEDGRLGVEHARVRHDCHVGKQAGELREQDEEPGLAEERHAVGVGDAAEEVALDGHAGHEGAGEERDDHRERGGRGVVLA